MPKHLNTQEDKKREISREGANGAKFRPHVALCSMKGRLITDDEEREEELRQASAFAVQN